MVHLWSAACILSRKKLICNTFQIVKIREIGATLLDSDDNHLDVGSEQEEESRQYVAQFADILANLDYMGQATVGPQIFSTL